MNIYLLRRLGGEVAYDEYQAKVIMAKNSKEARIIANVRVGDEGKIWLNPLQVSCTKIDLKYPGIIWEDLKAG